MNDDTGGHSKTLLLGFVNRVKALADEISDLQADITDICKEAKGAGFEPTKIREVVRWLRKVDKHGREKMDEAEAIFDLYRSVVDGGSTPLDEIMTDARDRALLKIFAGDDQVGDKLTDRRKRMNTALALAAGARKARHG